jgi:hypothetical protein
MRLSVCRVMHTCVAQDGEQGDQGEEQDRRCRGARGENVGSICEEASSPQRGLQASDDSSTREQVEHDSDNSFKEMSGSSALNGEKARLHSLKDLNSERYCSERSWSAPTLLSHTVSGRSSAPGLSSRETLETAVEEDEDVEQGHSFLSNAWSRPNGAPSTLPPWAFSSDNRHPSVARQLVGVEETTCSTPTASAPAVAEGDEEMTTPGLTGDNALLTSLLTA